MQRVPSCRPSSRSRTGRFSQAGDTPRPKAGDRGVQRLPAAPPWRLQPPGPDPPRCRPPLACRLPPPGTPARALGLTQPGRPATGTSSRGVLQKAPDGNAAPRSLALPRAGSRRHRTASHRGPQRRAVAIVCVRRGGPQRAPPPSDSGQRPPRPGPVDFSFPSLERILGPWLPAETAAVPKGSASGFQTPQPGPPGTSVHAGLRPPARHPVLQRPSPGMAGRQAGPKHQWAQEAGTPARWLPGRPVGVEVWPRQMPALSLGDGPRPRASPGTVLSGYPARIVPAFLRRAMVVTEGRLPSGHADVGRDRVAVTQVDAGIARLVTAARPLSGG